MTLEMANCAQRLDRNSNVKRMGDCALECKQKNDKMDTKGPLLPVPPEGPQEFKN